MDFNKDKDKGGEGDQTFIKVPEKKQKEDDFIMVPNSKIKDYDKINNELFIKYKNATDKKEIKRIKNLIYENNEGLVFKAAYRYRSIIGEEMDIVLSDMRLAFVKSLENYDLSRGKFSSYYFKIAKNEVIRTYYKDKKVDKNELLIFDEPIVGDDHDDMGTKGEQVPDPVDIARDVTNKVDISKIMEGVSLLKPREQKIIKGFYFDNVNGQALAKEIGLSRERVRMIHQTALRKLGRFCAINNEYFDEYKESYKVDKKVQKTILNDADVLNDFLNEGITHMKSYVPMRPRGKSINARAALLSDRNKDSDLLEKNKDANARRDLGYRNSRTQNLKRQSENEYETLDKDKKTKAEVYNYLNTKYNNLERQPEDEYETSYSNKKTKAEDSNSLNSKNAILKKQLEEKESLLAEAIAKVNNLEKQLKNKKLLFDDEKITGNDKHIYNESFNDDHLQDETFLDVEKQLDEMISGAKSDYLDDDYSK